MTYYKVIRNLIFPLLVLGVYSAFGQVYNMGNLGSVSTCSGNFYDSGSQGGNYGNNEHYTATFCSSSNQDLYFLFAQFQTESGYDTLYIFDGSSTSAPLIGAYSGSNSPDTIKSTNASHCLTFYFKTDGSVTYGGWLAYIGCGVPPTLPAAPAGTNCASGQPFCTGSSYNFPAATGTTAQAGPNYGCLLTQPNPVWYYLQIDTPGNINITLSNTNSVDVDFICWGPFPNSSACSQLNSANTVDCSYLPNSTEYINIANAQQGEYYILCITNYSNSPTNFVLTTDASSTATTNCQILCNITAMTASPSACDTATNAHTVSGSLTVQFPPDSGVLTITTSTGQVTTMSGPFTGTVNYTVAGVPSNGSPVTVTASFSTDTSCHFTTTYLAPANCTCMVTATSNSPVCTGATVNLMAVPAGSLTSYAWSGPNGFASAQQNPVINNAGASAAGIYTVIATGATCTVTDTTLVSVQPAPTISGTTQNISCNGAANGRIVVTTTATPPVTYNWAGNVSTGDTANALGAGNYNVTVTSAAGCSASAAFTITEPAAITFSNPVVTSATCSAGGSVMITVAGGTAPLGYLWSNGATTPSASNLAAGPYYLTVTDANGCMAIDSFVVPSAPNVVAFGPPQISGVSCYGGNNGAITVSAAGGSGAISYMWSTAQTVPTISGLTAGTYSVTASDANNCSASAVYVLNNPPAIVEDSVVITDFDCATGGSITVAYSGGTGSLAYSWSNAQYGSAINNLNAGNYTLTVTDQNQCTVTATYTVNPSPNAVILNTPVIVNALCNGSNNGSITANPAGASGNYTYAWSNGQTSATDTALAAGSYSVTVNDATGCSASAAYTVGEAAAVITSITPTNAICYGTASGRATADVAGGTPPYNYFWSDSQYTQTAMGLPAGTYMVTVFDANNCSSSNTATIGQPGQMVFGFAVTPVKCAGQQNGTITVDTAMGGTPPYNYSATSGGSNFVSTNNGVIENLAAGDYTVLVSDNNGCSKTYTLTVPAPSPDIFITSADSTSCYGSDYNDGEAHITDNSPQNGPYLYSIDGGPTQYSGDFIDLSAGQHIITAVSANQCVTDIPVVVLQPLPIVVDIEPDTVYLPLGGSAQVTATYINAINGTYLWGPFTGLSCIDCPNPSVSVFQNTDYLLTVSAPNGNATCYGTATLHAAVDAHKQVYIPNAFSPNGDGNNDVFMVYGEDIRTVELTIFNKWGELVFKTTNAFQGWDGTYKGQLQLPGVFTYSANITFLNGKTAHEKGTVTIIR